ncbi:hypothetical protein ACFSKL_11755 [Belliella marina]|uniref:Uncharacterized protein n=1 Tax=Belliella marina TaxID=1644146 RepID=A0ABW4VP57_9BACT
MSKQMRKYIDTFEEFRAKRKQFEVIVSYDCSQIHNNFANKLRAILRNNYGSQEITLSNYRIGKLLNFDEIDSLKKEILESFSESAPITEAKREKKTVVSIIVPSENQFVIDEIINEPVN